MAGKEKNKEGSITIEASAALTLFIFLVLYLYSFFVIFEAQGKVAVALSRTADSMALDTYAVSRLKLGEMAGSVSEWLVKLGVGSLNVHPEYVSTSDWSAAGADGELNNVAKQRLAAYLTNEGTKERANELLSKYRVDKGLDGLDFSESSVDSKGNLKLVVRYKVKYIFDYPGFHLKPLELKQQAVAHMWK